MSHIVVCPLDRIAEVAVRHRAREMVTLMAAGQDFHRPGVIDAGRHLKLEMNDISFSGSGKLVGPQEEHVGRLIGFVREWNRELPLLIHCWMGISRSPAAAVIAALALYPEQDERALAARLREASPHATPNARLIAIADRLLERQGRLISAISGIGRGADAGCGLPFTLSLTP